MSPQDQLDGLPIFSEPVARNTDPETSHEAAASMKEEAANQRRQILDVLRHVGPQTADSLDAFIGWRDTTAGRRLSELRTRNLAEETTVKAKTRSGRTAFVWRLKNVLAPREGRP